MGDRAFDSRVMESFVGVDGRLRGIPVQRKKRLVILRWLVEEFEVAATARKR